MAPLLLLFLMGAPPPAPAPPSATASSEAADTNAPAPTPPDTAEPLSENPPADADPAPAPPAQPSPKPAPAPAVPRLALLDLEAQNVDEATAKIVNTLITSAISDIGQFELITTNDIRRAVSFEEQKQNAGCDDTSCLAEIAEALGTQYLVYGELGKIGEQYVVHVDVFANEQGKTVNRVNFRTRDLDALTDEIDPAVRRLLSPIAPKPIAAAAGPAERSQMSLGLLTAGGALGVAGAVLAVAGAAVGGGTAMLLFQPSTPGALKSVWWVWMVGAAGAAVGVLGADAGAGLYVGGHALE